MKHALIPKFKRYNAPGVFKVEYTLTTDYTIRDVVWSRNMLRLGLKKYGALPKCSNLKIRGARIPSFTYVRNEAINVYGPLVMRIIVDSIANEINVVEYANEDSYLVNDDRTFNSLFHVCFYHVIENVHRPEGLLGVRCVGF